MRSIPPSPAPDSTRFVESPAVHQVVMSGALLPGESHGKLPGVASLLFNRAAARLLRLRCDSGVDDPRIMLSARAQKDPEVSRRERVRLLFISWYRAERTANDVLNFYLRLQQHDPDLLPHVEQHYTYKQLKADLDGLYQSER